MSIQKTEWTGILLPPGSGLVQGWVRTAGQDGELVRFRKAHTVLPTGAGQGLPVHIRERTGWDTWILLGNPVHHPGKAGYGGGAAVRRDGGTHIALQVFPMLAQDPGSGLVDIILLRLQELFTTDLPGLLHSTGLEGLLLALVSRRNLDRVRSWSSSRNWFW